MFMWAMSDRGIPRSYRSKQLWVFVHMLFKHFKFHLMYFDLLHILLREEITLETFSNRKLLTLPCCSDAGLWGQHVYSD